MSQEVTIGGDRLGSGNKMKQSIHDYEMSSFNLEQDWKSSMAPGVLYPFLKLVGTNHDTFDIDLDSFVRTLPTQGPLFGSFKLQCDIFSVPMRLYQGILHNNPVTIGLKMNQVYLPSIIVSTKDGANVLPPTGSDKYNAQMNNSCLLKYLGVSGIGKYEAESVDDPASKVIRRTFNAIPVLAYYDIFKNYYANKQEEQAYVITADVEEAVGSLSTISDTSKQGWSTKTISEETRNYKQKATLISNMTYTNPYYLIWTGENMSLDNIVIGLNSTTDSFPSDSWTLRELVDGGYLTRANIQADGSYIQLLVNTSFIGLLGSTLGTYIWTWCTSTNTTTGSIKLQAFDLDNIDQMRNDILSSTTLGTMFQIAKGGAHDYLPYSTLVNTTPNDITYNAFQMNGLCVKTYQSDLFNNWLDTEWIDGENGVSALSKITVDDDGGFTMDTLNLAQKIYNVLNRIAISGGTYEDWQEAVYGQGAVRKAETPMYMGGMAAEVMFEEVVSSSETAIDGTPQALGTLGGKGTQVGKKGGNNIHIKCEEPTYIIGIVSLTPRICYTQGNDWDMTELTTFDDLHKPGYDGIGFQEVMTEQMAWWDFHIYANDESARSSAGKQIAWINYQTAVDKAYGDFAAADGKAFMVLSRNYEMDDQNMLGDLTTYIDPTKYNYAFAVSDLYAQNFWTQIHSKIVARRKMAAKQIPNL